MLGKAKLPCQTVKVTNSWVFFKKYVSLSKCKAIILTVVYAKTIGEIF